MKGALAVMIELALAGAPFDCLFFGREELPAAHSALAPLLARERPRVRARGDDGADRQRAARGLRRQRQRDVDVPRPLGHSARPWDADNAIHAAARDRRVRRVRPRGASFDGLSFFEVASVTRIAGGIAQNVIPDRVDCHVNYRFAPGRTPDEAEARLRGCVRAASCGSTRWRRPARSPSAIRGRRR